MDPARARQLRRISLMVGLLIAAVAVGAYQVAQYRRENSPEPPPDVEKFQADSARMAKIRTASFEPASGSPGEKDWPQWRGPLRNGSSSEDLSRFSWPPEGPRRLWTARGGPGNSGIAVVQDRLVTMIQEGDDEAVICLDASSGNPVWSHKYKARFVEANAGVGPHATPTVADGRVYALGALGQFTCLEASSGKVLWELDLLKKLKGSPPPYGVACSPLVEGDLVIVQSGTADKGSIAAFNRKDGQPAWILDGEGGGYSSPVSASIEGRRQIVAVTGQALVGLAPENGALLWKFNWSTFMEISAATPVLVGNYVFISAGYGKGCALVEISKTGAGAFSARAVYEHNRMRNHFSTTVLVADHLYGFDENFLACMEVRSGKVRWKQRGFGKGSLIAAGRHLVVLGDDGRLALVEADPEGYRERGAFAISKSRCWTAPSLSRGKLYVRDQESIQCFDLGPDR